MIGKSGDRQNTNIQIFRIRQGRLLSGKKRGHPVTTGKDLLQSPQKILLQSAVGKIAVQYKSKV